MPMYPTRVLRHTKPLVPFPLPLLMMFLWCLGISEIQLIVVLSRNCTPGFGARNNCWVPVSMNKKQNQTKSHNDLTPIRVPYSNDWKQQRIWIWRKETNPGAQFVETKIGTTSMERVEIYCKRKCHLIQKCYS